MKNPTLATVLNIIPGLGYVYLGGGKRTFGVILLGAVLITLLASLNPALYNEQYMNASLTTWDVLSFVATLLAVAGFMYDGYMCANDYNRSLDVK